MASVKCKKIHFTRINCKKIDMSYDSQNLFRPFKAGPKKVQVVSTFRTLKNC